MDLIQRGKYQPRRDIDPESLQELADSIKVQGNAAHRGAPVSDRKYEIIAGEALARHQLAGLDSIPALVRKCRTAPLSPCR